MLVDLIQSDLQAPAAAATAWLMTYAVHSTVLAGGVLVASRFLPRVGPHLRDSLLKAALIGGILTASVQGSGVFSPAGGRWDISPSQSVAAPAVEAPVARDFVESLPPTRYGVTPMAWSPSIYPAALVSTTPAGQWEPTWDTTSTEDAPSVMASTGPVTTSPSLPARTESPPSPKGFSVPWQVALLALWAAGAVLGVTWFALRRWKLQELLSDRQDVQDDRAVDILDRLSGEAGMSEPVRLSVSRRISSPVALGTNEICVPTRALRALDDEQLECLLAHELAHLVRRDPSWLTLSLLIQSVFFFQPLNHLVRREMQRTAEFLCDDWAVQRTGKSLGLARCLAEVASWVVFHKRPLPLAGMAEKDSPLADRVARLLEEAQPRPGRTARLLGAAAVLSLLGATACLAPSVAADGGTKPVAGSAVTVGTTGKGHASSSSNTVTTTITSSSDDEDEAGTPSPAASAGSHMVIVSDGDDGAMKVEVKDGKVTTATLDGAELPAEDVKLDGNKVIITRAGKNRVVVVPGDNSALAYGIGAGDFKRRPMIGVNLGTVGEALAAQLGIDAGKVMLIENVNEDSPAAKAGMKDYDIITEVDGSAPATLEELHKAIDARKPGDKLPLKVLRKGQPVDLTITLEDNADDFPGAFSWSSSTPMPEGFPAPGAGPGAFFITPPSPPGFDSGEYKEQMEKAMEQLRDELSKLEDDDQLGASGQERLRKSLEKMEQKLSRLHEEHSDKASAERALADAERAQQRAEREAERARELAERARDRAEAAAERAREQAQGRSERDAERAEEEAGKASAEAGRAAEEAGQEARRAEEAGRAAAADGKRAAAEGRRAAANARAQRKVALRRLAPVVAEQLQAEVDKLDVKLDASQSAQLKKAVVDGARSFVEDTDFDHFEITNSGGRTVARFQMPSEQVAQGLRSSFGEELDDMEPALDSASKDRLLGAADSVAKGWDDLKIELEDK